MDTDIKETVRSYWQKRSVNFGFDTDEGTVNRWTAVLSKYFPDGRQKVLDIGTGPGFMASIAAMMGHDVTGIDFSEAMLKRAKENAVALGLSIHFALADTGAIPFDENSFDVVICRDVLWNILNPEEALLQWKRVVKPSGYLIYFDGNYYRYLFDDKEREEREQFLQTHEEYRLRKAALARDAGVSFAHLEQAACAMPLSKVLRPQWDVETLTAMGFSVIKAGDVTNELVEDPESIPSGDRRFIVAARKNT